VHGIGRLSMFAFAPCFVAGVIAYRLCMTRRPTLSAWWWPVAMVAAMALFAVCQATPTHLERGWPFCLFLGCLIPLIAELPVSWMTRAAAQVAKYSYGVYLSHVLLLWVSTVVLYDAPALVRWSVFAALLVVVPVAAYHLIEAPAIRLGVRLAHGTLRANGSQIDASTAPAP
jgi:peptidoglycan/LPS O-acetylase OafA/YrhL